MEKPALNNGLDPFAHDSSPPSLLLDSRSLALFLAMNLGFYFHQLLGQGFMIVFKVIINLIIGGKHLR